MYEHGVLAHFYQQDVEPINELAEGLDMPHRELIGQASLAHL